ncbi:type III-B CRISPR-associated protein Cas10/Cmr2 [Desulfoscipio gibsoniae]
MNGTRYLHFTIGPVQSFVAQSRRTRDLWAGSFLLSYLSGQAMYAVQEAKGRIIFPAVHDEGSKPQDALLKAITKRNEGHKVTDGPNIGTLPNRFKAEVPVGFDPNACTRALQDAWTNIARSVWDEYVASVAGVGKDVALIWERQVNSFWDIAWAVSDDEDSNGLLGMRKNWRSHVLEVEPGDKCTIMGNLQELSGYIRARKSEKEKQDAFWAALRKKVELELREDERLCAIAFIKRFFPLLAGRVIWGVPLSYPSTTYIAAAHWMEKAMRENTVLACDYAALATNSKLIKSMGVHSCGAIKCINHLVDKQPCLEKFARLSANLFYNSILDNDGVWPENTLSKREQLKKLLNKFNGHPGSYYSVLLMDGDEMGVLLQKFKAREVSNALACFSQKVPSIIGEKNGVLIYAGGDDVLALLPLEDALDAAVSLCLAYRQSFTGTAVPGSRATISASILYAHHHAPLKSILIEAHRMLDKIAKDKIGRDSLAVGVWKTAGPDLLWSSPWEKVIVGNENNIVNQMVKNFTGDSNEQGQYNSAFFYNLRRRFEILMEDDQLIPDLNPVKLLAAEYMKNRDRSRFDVLEAEKRMESLLDLCRCSRREAVGDDIKIIPKNNLQMDGALLVRFLAEKGVGE